MSTCSLLISSVQALKMNQKANLTAKSAIKQKEECFANAIQIIYILTVLAGCCQHAAQVHRARRSNNHDWSPP